MVQNCSKNGLLKQLNIMESGKPTPALTMKDDDDEPKMFLYDVHVHDIGQVDALIDSGSNVCVIKRDVITDPTIISKIIPMETTTTLFDGSEMVTLGHINLRVTFLGETVEMRFTIVTDLHFPMLLGANWIRKGGAILQSNGTELGVTLGGKEEVNKDGRIGCPQPRILVKVDGIDGLVGAMVDTGAQYSAIRQKLVRKESDVPTCGTIPAILANGKRSEIESERVSLNVTYQRTTTRIGIVYVVSEMSEQFILGLDWIHKTRVVIQPDGSNIIVTQPDLQ